MTDEEMSKWLVEWSRKYGNAPLEDINLCCPEGFIGEKGWIWWVRKEGWFHRMMTNEFFMDYFKEWGAVGYGRGFQMYDEWLVQFLDPSKALAKVVIFLKKEMREV